MKWKEYAIALGVCVLIYAFILVTKEAVGKGDGLVFFFNGFNTKLIMHCGNTILGINIMLYIFFAGHCIRKNEIKKFNSAYSFCFCRKHCVDANGRKLWIKYLRKSVRDR